MQLFFAFAHAGDAAAVRAALAGAGSPAVRLSAAGGILCPKHLTRTTGAERSER